MQPVWLGIFGQDVDPQIASYLRLRSPRGFLVTEVVKSLPAEREGIKPGDVILSINEVAIEDKEDYIRYLLNTTSESKLKIRLYREGKFYETSPLTRYILLLIWHPDL